MECAVKYEEASLWRTKFWVRNGELCEKFHEARRKERMAELEASRDTHKWILSNQNTMTAKHYLPSNPVEVSERNFNEVKLRQGMFLAAVSPISQDEYQTAPDDKYTVKPNSWLTDAMRRNIPRLAKKGSSKKVWCAASLVCAITFFFSHYARYYKCDKNPVTNDG